MWYYTGYSALTTALHRQRYRKSDSVYFLGDRIKAGKMRTTYCMTPQVILKLIRSGIMLLDVQEDYTSHPLGQGAYKFQTIINSDQLGVLSALPMKEYRILH